MLKKILMIANPGSGKGTAPDYAKKLKRILEDVYQSEVGIRQTTQVGDATNWATSAKDEQYDTVIGFGGDGTVNEIINGLMKVDKPPVFSFLPMGTANDLGRVLGFDMNPDLAIEQFKNLAEDTIDVGQINNHYFMDVVAIGDIPRAVMETDSEKKNRFGFLAYILDGAKAIVDGEGGNYLVTDSKGAQFEIQSNAIIMALTSSIGGLENVVEHRQYNDGLLQFAALKGNILTSALDTFTNKNGVPEGFINDENLLAFSDQSISVKGLDSENKEIVTNVDGDKGPILPINIRVHHNALKVLRPQGY